MDNDGYTSDRQAGFIADLASDSNGCEQEAEQHNGYVKAFYEAGADEMTSNQTTLQKERRSGLPKPTAIPKPIGIPTGIISQPTTGSMKCTGYEAQDSMQTIRRGGTQTPPTPGKPGNITGSTTPHERARSGSTTPHKIQAGQKVAIIRTPSISPSYHHSQELQVAPPMPDVKHVRAKIRSTENLSHHPGGGKVQIFSQKTTYGHVQAKCQSMDNVGHTPRNSQVQIQSKKMDFSHVTAKCGSKDNLSYKSGGGGSFQVVSHKVNYKDKAKSKVGSLENTSHTPGGGNVKIESQKLNFRERAQARTDHGADIVICLPAHSSTTTPRRLSNASTSGDGPHLSTLAADVSAALAQQGF
uniref:microtubule-associated protein tau-like n=1 Tax=Myxine glutinosa TaxID=7769 RepID=UPI00358E514C